MSDGRGQRTEGRAPTPVGVETERKIGYWGLEIGERIAHVPHSRDALSRAKDAKPRRRSGRRRGSERGGGRAYACFRAGEREKIC